MYVRLTLLAISISTAMLVSAHASADVLSIGGQPQVVTRNDLPTRGTRRAAVLARYGEPKSRNSAVGNPPISSWDYGEFVVYFEYDHVVHTVVHQR